MSRLITRRSFLCLCFSTALVALNPCRALGFERPDHDAIMEKILFGHSNKLFLDADKNAAISALESACFLCLDQMRDDGEKDLERLIEFGVSEVSEVPKLDDIKLTGIFYVDHDDYTHKGWHYSYDGVEIGEPKEKWGPHWIRRKKLLVDTVNTVFDFGWFDYGRISLLGMSEGTRCDAFAELLYYIHVLGDYRDNIQENLKKEIYKVNLKAIPFATDNPSNENRDFFWDLKEALGIIFTEEATRGDYERCSSELDEISSRARELGEVSSKSSAEKFRKYVMQTEDLLWRRIPGLLKDTDFFKQRFYLV